MVKKLLSVLLIAVIVLSCMPTNVYASSIAENEVTVTVYPKKLNSQANEVFEDGYTNILNDNQLLRGDSKPTKFYDLTEYDYYYDIPNYASNVYTERYFNASYMNEISIQTSGLDSVGKNIDINLYELGGGKVGTWTGNPQSIEGLGFNGLSTSKYYYFQIKASVFSKVIGSGKIHHHYKK